MNKTFAESKYIDKISFDFEDLPHYIIQQGIIWKFEKGRFLKDSDYLNWRKSLSIFLETTPESFHVKFLQKAIEYSKSISKYHEEKECDDTTVCQLNQAWNRRISMAQEILTQLLTKNEQKKEHFSKSNPENSYTSEINLPILDLTESEKMWMSVVYERMKEGKSVSFKEIWALLHQKLPINFRPVGMDPRLISSGGEELRLLGVVALEKNYLIIEKINSVIYAIRSTILSNHEIRNIQLMEITEKTDLGIAEITLCLQFAQEFGTFYTSSASDSESHIMKSIDVGGNDNVFYTYIQFQGIEYLVAAKPYSSQTIKGETFTINEIISMNQRLDEVLKDLQTLKTGQEIIWTDFLKEIDELKELYSLPKKNWKQLFIGKVVEMVTSGVISETVSKSIVEAIQPNIGKLLN